MWFNFPEVTKEAKQKFLEYRNSLEIFDIIRNAPVGTNIFKDLGLKKYKNHWFIKK